MQQNPSPAGLEVHRSGFIREESGSENEADAERTAGRCEDERRALPGVPL